MYSILIIDQDSKSRDELFEWLTDDGFHVSMASDGVSGVNLFLEKLPDLLIADTDLPGLNGYDLLKKIREITGGLPPVFIFLSSKSRMLDMRKGMIHGADDFLFKPVSKADLINAVNTRLSIRKRLVQGITFNASLQSTMSSPFNLNEVDAMLDKLSKTELRILKFISEEKSSAEIALILYISPKTVENHRHSIARKLSLKGSHSVLSLALKLRSVLGSMDLA